MLGCQTNEQLFESECEGTEFVKRPAFARDELCNVFGNGPIWRNDEKSVPFMPFRVSSVRFRDFSHAWERAERGKHVSARTRRANKDASRALNPVTESLCGVFSDDSAFVDDDHAMTGATDFGQDVA